MPPHGHARLLVRLADRLPGFRTSHVATHYRARRYTAADRSVYRLRSYAVVYGDTRDPGFVGSPGSPQGYFPPGPAMPRTTCPPDQTGFVTNRRGGGSANRAVTASLWLRSTALS
ncbi:hypothetical protein GCM10022226_69730 [Sphaerisporangium flaviroseum]|uniref:Uncharacterized protein n=1 Tax=Sphaerisporangium flaviroseum TaxID=509199 RepID=A0ABP7J8T5_9ACTN